MVEEVVKFLVPGDRQIIVDGTVGGGGHLAALKKACPECRFVAIDQDEEALVAVRQRLGDQNIEYVHDNFRNIVLILKQLEIKQVDGILLDLGVSTHQLETSYRGFSFNIAAPLDMRMDHRRSLTAAWIVNKWPEQKIREILYRFGEEPHARAIAKAIINARSKSPIKTTNQLVEILKHATPPSYRYSRRKIHFATNTFRALRMAVNDELGALESFLKQVLQVLEPGGKVAIITFHSLEDRLVKQAMRSLPGDMIDLRPSASEIQTNPKARSARLRAFQMAH